MNCEDIWKEVKTSAIFCLPTPSKRSLYIECALSRMCSSVEKKSGKPCTALDRALLGSIAAMAFDYGVSQSACVAPLDGSKRGGTAIIDVPADLRAGGASREGSSCSVAVSELEIAVSAFTTEAIAFVVSIPSGGFGASGKLLSVADGITSKYKWIPALVQKNGAACGTGNICVMLTGLSLAMSAVHEWALNSLGNPKAPPQQIALALEGLDAAYIVDILSNKIESGAACA